MEKCIKDFFEIVRKITGHFIEECHVDLDKLTVKTVLRLPPPKNFSGITEVEEPGLNEAITQTVFCLAANIANEQPAIIGCSFKALKYCGGRHWINIASKTIRFPAPTRTECPVTVVCRLVPTEIAHSEKHSLYGFRFWAKQNDRVVMKGTFQAVIRFIDEDSRRLKNDY